MVTDEASYLKPVMTPVAWVAGIWLTALDLHLSHRGVKTERNGNRFKQTSKNTQIFVKKCDQKDYFETSGGFRTAEDFGESLVTLH